MFITNQRGRPAAGVAKAFLATLILLAGCSRAHYRVATDRDAYGLLAEKTACTPWQPPPVYDVLPHPLSRFHDPTVIEDPLLPQPAPQLYAYRLPDLGPATRRPTGGRDERASRAGESPNRADPVRLPPANPARDSAAWSDDSRVVVPASYLGAQATLAPPRTPVADSEVQKKLAELMNEDQLNIQPIKDADWRKLPRSALQRMLEFDSVRKEWAMTYGQQPSQSQLDPAPRLTLENIVQLASINSREYQSQKETLYRSALRLSLERFDYQLKFSPNNNRVAANYDHTWVDGISDAGLAVPATMQVERLLATGGDLLARFANNVVLTFNGPQGFAADVTSDALFQVSQSVFQRDIRLEPLTQAERDVVYAARTFARFRKSLFNQLASDYYRLLLAYRQIEISSLSYFQLARAFDQSRAEYSSGTRARFEVDQVEQQLLSGRSRLIGVSNALENSLDSLKIRIGLPTETPINLDLGELNELTLRDELSVTGDLIQRTAARLAEERNRKVPEPPNRDTLLSTSVALLDRMIRIMDVKSQLGEESTGTQGLQLHRARFAVQASRSRLKVVESLLQEARREGTPSVPVLMTRTLDLLIALRDLSDQQLTAIEAIDGASQATSELRAQLLELIRGYNQLRSDLEELIVARDVSRLAEYLQRASQIEQAWQRWVQAADQRIQFPPDPPDPAAALAQTVQDVDQLLKESAKLTGTIADGLAPIDIPVDDAMLTALVLRMDLMNERGALADDWRRIKLTADELRSVLNLNASQSLSSRRNLQGGGDFTVDTMRSQVNVTFDAPLNRRAQRNTYRTALIDYQVGLRSLMQLEDSIKLSTRNDLRNLSLAKEQYAIDVASAALAYERVVSTALELQLAVSGRPISARDYLESQSAYVNALSSVATRHIGYITDRTQLFLDLELLTVDDEGFWDALYDEKQQPVPYYQLPPHAMPAYGELPIRVWHSRAIKRMCEIPTGISAVQSEPPAAAGSGPSAGNQPQPEAIQTPPPQTP